MRINLTTSEISVAMNALWVAEGEFKASAATCRKEPGHAKLTEQFDGQARDARALADRLEQEAA